MCSLNNEAVSNGIFELYVNGSSIDILIKGSALSSAQIGACSSSCNGGPQISCALDEGKEYTGTCQKVCCLSSGNCGATVQLTSCCGG